MKEGWMKSDEGWMKSDEGWMKNDERWRMQYDDFKLLKGFDLWQTDERTDICDCRVAFATEKCEISHFFFSSETFPKISGHPELQN